MDMIRRGMKHLGRELRDHASCRVNYSGSAFSLLLPATISPPERLVDDSDGVLMVACDMEFVISRTDLVDQTRTPTEPARGDTIVAEVGGQNKKFQVTQDQRMDAWTWTDSSRTRMRIRTKEIGAA
jgi:hypothetical protein